MEVKVIQIIATLDKPMRKAAAGIILRINILLDIAHTNVLPQEKRSISENISGMLIAMEELGLTVAQCTDLLNILVKVSKKKQEPKRTAKHIN